MTMIDVKDAFSQCEYPFYKNLVLNNGSADCTIYSIHSDYKQEISIPLNNYDEVIHTISLAIIKMRSYEFIHDHH
jgi:hypothetical protein